MKAAYLKSAAAAALATLAAAPAQAQYQPQYPAAPVQQPLATQASVSNLDNRVVSLEQQLAQLIRLQEENGHRINQLEGQLRKSREDAATRIAVLEAQLAAARAAPAAAADEPSPEAPKPAVASTERPKPIAAVASAETTDAAEEAYDSGYQLWKAGKYDEAIGALRAFTSAYPKHRRTSWANNLAGRAMLDKGEPRAAAEALLANYRANPKGERAADSLYYLGQALMKLGQPSQACKAYAELESVYGDKVRGEIKGLLPKAKAEAKCA